MRFEGIGNYVAASDVRVAVANKVVVMLFKCLTSIARREQLW